MDSINKIPQVLRCRVEQVYPERYSVDVKSIFGTLDLRDVEIGSVYGHPDGAEGADSMPEVGTEVSVCLPSDGSRPFVFRYLTDFKESGGYRNSRMDLGPGDQVLASRDGNRVVVRRGGVVEVSSGSMCQMFFLPIGNLIRSIFGQSERLSVIGEETWKHKPADPSSGGAGLTTILYEFKSKEHVEDPKATVEIRAGYVEVDLLQGASAGARAAVTGAVQTVYEVQTFLQGVPTWTLRVDRAGNTYFQTSGNQAHEVMGNAYFSFGGTAKAENRNGSFSLLVGADGALITKCSRAELDFVSSLDLTGKTASVDAMVFLGGPKGTNGMEPGAKATTLVNWLMGHTHDLPPPIGMGLPSGPPSAPHLASVQAIKATRTFIR